MLEKHNEWRAAHARRTYALFINSTAKHRALGVESIARSQLTGATTRQVLVETCGFKLLSRPSSGYVF